MVDRFAEIRARVPAIDAARRYGISINAQEKALCPFHNDKHPSMSFKNGRWRCFTCNAGGSSVDLVARLLDVDPMTAARRIDADFGLGLFNDMPLTAKQKAELRSEIRQRKEQQETQDAFNSWAFDMKSKVEEAIRVGKDLKDSGRSPYEMNRREFIAYDNYDYLVSVSDAISSGDEREIAILFANRKGVLDLCRDIITLKP